ncbi:hypothetical protein [Yoonia sp. SS1-5]|uniref:Outer membrane beta-barrel protein n=1 Tax=Yoonia rhodophyticola TaxID=3137370 RepID=A0AAN0MFW2_9RHOB
MCMRSGLVGALAVGATPGFAQDGGIQTTFGIAQSIEGVRNPALAIPAEDADIAATTTLSYSIVSETRTQLFRFGADSSFRIEYDDDDELIGEFEAPTLTFGYTRAGATSSFSASARFLREEIDSAPDFSDFVTDDGILEIPDDFTDLSGTGRRTGYTVASILTLGRDRPLGFEFEIGTSGVLYEDVTDPDLTDVTNVSARVGTLLRFSDVLSGRLSYGYSLTEEDDTAETVRRTQSIGAGLTYNLSPRSTFDIGIGAEQTETEVTTGTSEVDGLTGRLGYRQVMPNGDLTAVLDASRDVAGDLLLEFRLGRSLALPTGTLAVSVGATRPDGDDPAFIGTVDYTYILPDQRILLRLDRSVTIDLEDDIRRRTLLGAFYSYDINRFSSLSLGISHIVAEESDAAGRVERTDLTGSYSYALTADWDLSAGFAYSVRDEEAVGEADSSLISISLSREFTSRR